MQNFALLCRIWPAEPLFLISTYLTACLNLLLAAYILIQLIIISKSSIKLATPPRLTLSDSVCCSVQYLCIAIMHCSRQQCTVHCPRCNVKLKMTPLILPQNWYIKSKEENQPSYNLRVCQDNNVRILLQSWICWRYWSGNKVSRYWTMGL